MQLKEFNIMLDIKKSRKIEEIEVVQGDTNTNILYISIVESLVPYDLAGITVEIVFAKPDGTTVVQDATNGLSILDAAAGKIKCVLLTNTIAAPGRVNAEVRLLQNDKLLTSARFEFYVRRAIMNDETIESTNEFPVLTQLIQEVQQITAQVPEEVVNNLNALTTYVNELAGQGRTTETVKQNADDIVNLSNDLETHKAEMTSKLGRVEFNCTPKTGYKIVDSKCFVVNSIAYLSIEVKKTDDAAFSTGLASLATVAHNLAEPVILLTTYGLSAGGSPKNVTKGTIFNYNKTIGLAIDDADITRIFISGIYLLA